VRGAWLIALTDAGADPGRPAGGRKIAKLALPALGALAAEPRYLLFDTGLVIGGLVLGVVGS
jgi:MATE family, multidrug efflux pump